MEERPAGWYWAEGDPEDTVREWNGTAWVGEPEHATHEPLDQLAKYTQIALIASAVLAGLFLIAGVMDLNRLIDFARGDTEDAGLRAAEVRRFMNRFDGFTWPVFLATAGLFIAWFHRAYANLRAIQRTARHRPNWAIISWFIPIANLWIVSGLMRELSPDVYANDEDDRPTDRLIGPWWVLYAGSGIAALVLAFIDARDTYDQIAWVATDSAARLAEIAAAMLAIVLVRRVTDYQDAKLS